MKNLKLCFLLLGIFCLMYSGYSQSVLELQTDTIRTNTEWNTDIVKVGGDIAVMEGARLTIAPGTYVEFQGHHALIIYGYLSAVGTDQDSITFTINDNTGFTNHSTPDGGWLGINFLEAGSHDDTSKIDRCRISYVKKYANGGFYETEGGINIRSTHKVTIRNSLMEHNYTRNDAPGVYIESDLVSFVEISNCIFRYNEARYGSGGGVASYCKGKAIIKDNLIHDNDMDGAGGISVRSNALIMNNIIINNYSDGSGGGIDCNGGRGDVKIIGNVICNNWAKSSGGGIAVSGEAYIINNTICNNELKEDWEQGGGIYVDGDPYIINNIIWGNEDNQVGFYPADPDEINATFRNNVIQFGTGGFNPDYVKLDQDNLSGNPFFVEPSSGYGIQPGAVEADWSVQPSSVCMNNGTLENIPALPGLDAYGNPRIENGRVEVGAVETHIRKIEVCGDLPADTILTADTILVTCDVFVPDTVTVRIPPGSKVIFTGHYRLEVEGNLLAEGTETDSIHFYIADTSGFSSAVIDSGGWNGIHMETDHSSFSYCTFRYSKSSESGGALLFNWGSSGSINNCLFEYNKGYEGGALYGYGSTLVIDQCIFRYNSAYHGFGRGGGLQFNNMDLTLTNTTIIYNTSSYGGALGVVSSDSHIEQCTLAWNYPDGIFYESAIPEIVNCFIYSNEGSGVNLPEGGEGGIIFGNLVANNQQGFNIDNMMNPVIANNTIVNNTTSGISGENSRLNLTNNILFGNGAGSIDITSSIYTISHCLIQGGIDQQYFKNGNIEEYSDVLDEDPYFTKPVSNVGPGFDAMQADWSVNALSPCFDAGATVDLDNLLPGLYTDLAGNSRINSAGIDIGAFEHPGSIPVFISQPEGGNICEDNQYTLSVEASDTVLYQWMKDGENLPGGNAAELVLNDVDFWDQGEYRCMITNYYGQALSNPAYVFVTELPEFLSEPKDIWIAKDEPIVLNALIKGTNPNLAWVKDGELLTGENSTTLFIENPDSSNEGTYTCIISNLCGADTTGEADVFIVPQLCMVTVDPATGNNLVIWEKTSKAPVDYYKVYRESQAAGIYDLLGSVPGEKLSVLVDTTADPTVQAYLYKITAVDTSGYETSIDLCEPHKTIHLLVSTNPELNTTQLEWDRYYGFEYSTYNILRSATGSGFLPVHFLASSLASWTDPDPLPETGFYRISVDKPVPCVPAGSGNKADAGPYSHSMSNVEDNRLQAGESPPDTILLSKNNINTNNSIGALVGRLSTIDADTLDSHLFSLVNGEGDDDNKSFTVLGDLLLAAETFDYEVQDEYSIRVRCKDEGNLTREQVFTIYVWGPSGTMDQETIKISVYPNPFTHSTMIEFPNPGKIKFRMFITDLSGKVVRFEDNIFGDNIQISRDNLPAGVYFVELRGDRIYRDKLVIE